MASVIRTFFFTEIPDLNFSIPAHFCVRFINDVLSEIEKGKLDFKKDLGYWNKTSKLLKVLWAPVDLEEHQEKEKFLTKLEERRQKIIPKEERDKLYSKL